MKAVVLVAQEADLEDILEVVVLAGDTPAVEVALVDTLAEGVALVDTLAAEVLEAVDIQVEDLAAEDLVVVVVLAVTAGSTLLLEQALVLVLALLSALSLEARQELPLVALEGASLVPSLPKVVLAVGKLSVPF